MVINKFNKYIRTLIFKFHYDCGLLNTNYIQVKMNPTFESWSFIPPQSDLSSSLHPNTQENASPHSHSHYQNQSTQQLSSCQLMKSLNSSFDGLFSRIQQLKQEHAPPGNMNSQKINRLPKLVLKGASKSQKSEYRPVSNKQMPKIQKQKSHQDKKNYLKIDKTFEAQGLLSIPSLKASMEITDDVINTSIDKKSSKFGNSSISTVDGLKISDFTLGKCVGSGKFGDVFMCIHKKTNTVFALKKIFKSTILEYNMVQQFTKQLRIHYLLDHPNIVKLYTHFDDDYHIFLLMEYAEGGILLNKLRNGQQYTSRIIEQTINAVDYLHSKKIAHRDIKPENIVLQFDNVAKLCDFGWSSFYHNEMKTTFCGTLDYLSPEMKERGKYNSSVDIWSVGVLTYELILGEAPYKKQLNNWKNKGSRREEKTNWNIIYPMTISTVAESFLRNLLKENPDERGSLQSCLKHFFIRKYRQQESEEQYQELNRIL